MILNDIHLGLIDHTAISSAHHPRYTDAEALAACNLNGNLYWACSGAAFLTRSPDTDQVTKALDGFITVDADGIYLFAPVNIPDGATVTGIIVTGNAAAAAETYSLIKKHIAIDAITVMATENINTDDSTITESVIDYNTYCYYIRTSSLDTNDVIHGARIAYTI